MEFIRGIHNLKPHHRGCALTIGNFDGFHRGHQELIAQLLIVSRGYGLPVMVIIFEPQPEEYFTGIVMRLTRLRDKVRYLSSAGVDMVLCISFNNGFASLQACSFINILLLDKLNIKLVFVGDDFHFGVYRQGDIKLLQQFSLEYGFKVISMNTCINDGERISSTAIRIALMQDRLVEAEMLLGHSYCISGRVVYGNALGKVIGFPTANISLKGQQLPVNGVYIVEVYGVTDHPLSGVANIGFRPTISGSCQVLEVHLLDLTINLYGYYIEVVILSKLRNEQHFSSREALMRQINNDVINARNYFKLRCHDHT